MLYLMVLVCVYIYIYIYTYTWTLKKEHFFAHYVIFAHFAN